jgi:hypothetical protein
MCCTQEDLHTHQALYWQHYRINRIKEAAADSKEQAWGTQQQQQQQQQPSQQDPMVS